MALSEFDALFEVIDQIAFHAVDDLEELLRINRRKSLFFSLFVLCRHERVADVVGVREGLHIAVVSDRDRGHSPRVSSLDQILALGNSVHITHLGMAVKLDSLYLCAILSLFDDGRNAHNTLQRRNGYFLIKGIKDRCSFDFDPAARLERSQQFVSQ